MRFLDFRPTSECAAQGRVVDGKRGRATESSCSWLLTLPRPPAAPRTRSCICHGSHRRTWVNLSPTTQPHPPDTGPNPVCVRIIRPRRSTSRMRPLATDCAAWFVCRSVDRESCKTAKPIEMPFGLWNRVGQRNYVLDGFQILTGGGTFEGMTSGFSRILSTNVPIGRPHAEAVECHIKFS